ncbi:hypothetical protein FGIG_11154 [Fasciola gigantica]|uniref:Uncharacterized protein n=1 Tax=Fasciola gigantica TaxID=46835 RepID=A0A504YU36_FASGI|nr:hypothetical protein FGIG_11154 [Fasciola gigantica]
MGLVYSESIFFDSNVNLRTELLDFLPKICFISIDAQETQSESEQTPAATTISATDEQTPSEDAQETQSESEQTPAATTISATDAQTPSQDAQETQSESEQTPAATTISATDAQTPSQGSSGTKSPTATKTTSTPTSTMSTTSEFRFPKIHSTECLHFKHEFTGSNSFRLMLFVRRWFNAASESFNWLDFNVHRRSCLLLITGSRESKADSVDSITKRHRKLSKLLF